MRTQVMIQSTPNPNALKFVLDQIVKTEGNITYKGIDTTEGNPLAEALFKADARVKEVYFYDNYITVTQDGGADWGELEQKLQKIITEKYKYHNPDFVTTQSKTEPTSAVGDNEELKRIDAILDQTIRPALQMDGGDVQVMSYENDIVKIFYQGACGSCPSATMGTLYAIENILKEQFNSNVSVALDE